MVPRHRRQYLPFSSFHPDSQNGASCLKHTPCKPAAANDRKVNGDTDSQPGLLSTLRSRCLLQFMSTSTQLLATTTALHVTQTCRMFPSDFFFIDFVLPSHTNFRKRLQTKHESASGHGGSSSCSQSSPLAFSQPASAYSASSKDICSLCSWHFYIPFAKHSEYLSS